MNREEFVLEIHNLSVSFEKDNHSTCVLRELSFGVKKGEILAIVGASGSGKSILAHAIMDILPKNAKRSGTFTFQGEEIQNMDKIRGRQIALVPQSVSCLDPLMKVSKQVKGSNSKEVMNGLFQKYGLCEKAKKLYPFQYSGGMARRALIATCEEHDPQVIIADEPTPGLDLELAKKTLRYFKDMAENGKSIVLITHDIDLSFEVADRIAVFYEGTILEVAPVADFVNHTVRHPYTKDLLKALPQNEFQYSAVESPKVEESCGCVYAKRCVLYTEECNHFIEMKEAREGWVRCIHAT